ncbi:MAG TPA: GNAT family N-acetyltransferase [Flavipsychrobacter sp.]|nr:GNAT family N-acetyltransferase [Flavipsychrobacter sp.]
MSIELKTLTSQDIEDFSDLIDLFENVFEMKDFTKPDNKYLQGILAKPGFFALIAKIGNKVVGGLTVYVLDQYYSKKPLAYIYDVAIATEHQRQGIGKALIKYLIDFCREKGFEEAYVQADRVDDHAIEFYRSTKISSEGEVVQFSYLF